MYVEYETQCGNCSEYDFQGDNKKGYCNWYGSYYYPGDSCRHQTPRRSSSESSCYITTVVCNLIGESDNCVTLNVLRFFRNEVMQKDPKYRDLLYEYDTVGPIIASNLIEEFNSKNGNFKMVNDLYNKCIKKVVSLIGERKIDEAVKVYENMTKSLEEYYGINYKSEIPDNYDYTKGGHGKKYTK